MSTTKDLRGQENAETGREKRGQAGELANQSAAKPVSLAPLRFEEAVKGLLAVKPQRERADGKRDG